MKEATGEASMTGITIAIIAVIAAIAIPIVTNLLRGLENNSCCQANGGIWQGGQCFIANTCDDDGDCTGGTPFQPECE